MRNLVPCLALLSLAGCATLANGHDQTIKISTMPPGAACVVDEVGAPQGEHIDLITSTPSYVLLHRANKPIKVTCALQGYPVTQVIQSYGVNGNAGLNVFNGVIVGTLIDNASGALYRYPPEVRVDLTHTPPAASSAMHGNAPRMGVTPTSLAPLPAKPHA